MFKQHSQDLCFRILTRAGSDSEALTFSVPHSPRSCLLLTPQMQVITDVYLSVTQTQDTCTAINSSFARVNHSHVIAYITPTAHWESLGNIDGIYSLEISSTNQTDSTNQRSLSQCRSLDNILFQSCQGSN